MTPEGLNHVASTWTQLFFIVFAHLILWFGLVTTFVVIQRAIWEERGFERLSRAFAFLAAPLTILGARAFDVSLPELLVRALAISNPFLTTTVGLVLPGGVGVLAAWFFIRVINKGNRAIATRIMIMAGTFIMFEFGDVYVAALKAGGVAVSKYLAPNLAFTLALFLYVALNYGKEGLSSISGPQVGVAGD